MYVRSTGQYVPHSKADRKDRKALLLFHQHVPELQLILVEMAQSNQEQQIGIALRANGDIHQKPTNQIDCPDM